MKYGSFWKKKYAFGEVPTVEERIFAATEGLVRAYKDPYTVFFPPVESQAFTEEIEGEFGGVGMEVGVTDGFITVIAPLENSPAQKAGIQTGDTLIQVDGQIIIDLGIDEVIQRIKGEVGTSVTLTILREGIDEPLNITITRDIIQIPILDTEILNEEVFLISLYNFSEQAPDAFKKALLEFENSNTEKLILDLRGNPGGFLEGAVDIASWFLPQGKVIVREESKNVSENFVYRSKGYDVFQDTLEMIILIDEGSASASEILAGALVEHDKATLVGAQTFGKGSVQEFISTHNESSLKVTVAEWFTPKGISISEEGLTPEYLVEYTLEDFEANRDPQLEKALELLSSKSVSSR